MISIQRYVNKYKYKCNTNADSVVQVRMVSLTSDFSSSTWGERHNSYYADLTMLIPLTTFMEFKISFGRDPKNPTTSSTAQSQLQLNGRELNFLPIWSDFNFLIPCSDPNFSTQRSDLNWTFFKIFQILSPSLLGMTSSTIQPHFLSGVHYENGDCHILCARA